MTDPDGWTLAEFRVPGALAELVSDLLWAGGVAAVEESEDGGVVILRTSVDPSVTADVLAKHPTVTVSAVRVSSSVADTWREHATPTRVSGDAWLVPAWVEPPAVGTSVLVEPYDTFGLGNHPTTVLALRAALAAGEEGCSVLDVGSGSGVLSVALAVLRSCSCTATDIAPQARQALLANAELNGVATRVRWTDALANVTTSSQRMVVANILAPVLRDLSDHLQRACEPGGRIILSGMRADQVDGVVSCYASCTEASREEADGWVAVTLLRA